MSSNGASECLLAIAVIEIHVEETGKKQGKIDCPICGGKNTLSYSRGDKSVWVSCCTDGCVKCHGDMK